MSTASPSRGVHAYQRGVSPTHKWQVQPVVEPHTNLYAHSCDDSGYPFELFEPNQILAAPDFPFQQFTENSNDGPYRSSHYEASTANAYYALNSEGIPQPDITTPSQHDSQFLGQLSADCNPLQLSPPFADPTANEWTNESIPASMPRLDAGAAEGIDVFSQEHSLYSFRAPDLSDMECLGLGLDEVPNIFDATGVDEISSFGQQAVAPLPAPYQRQGDDPLATDVSTPYRCMACGLHFNSSWHLEKHCSTTEHRGYTCPTLDCEDAYSQKTALRDHIRDTHPELRSCNQCQAAFSNIATLGKHASETGHASFFCLEDDCGKTFSRFDVFQRHLDTHRSNVRRFPCQHCRRHRGANGFKRKDHLTQHLRNYHHIGVDDVSGNSRSCPHGDCPEWKPAGTRGDQHAFQKGSDYIAHMRKVHKESEFPCTEPGCDRTGPKGYFRMRDFQKHKLKAHGIPIE